MSILYSPVISLPNNPSLQNQTPTLKTFHTNHKTNHQTLSLIEKCTNIKHLKQIHAHMLRTSLFFDPYSASKLITAFTLTPFSNLNYAHQLFDQISLPNLYTWNLLIRAYSSSNDPIQCFSIFIQMLHRCNELPNKFTYPFVIKAASELLDFQIGRAFHGMVIKGGFGSDVFILNSLIHFYGSCKDLDLAYRVFVKMNCRDVVSWNSVITAFAQGECHEEVLKLFNEMEEEKIKPNDVTMMGILSSCTKRLDLKLGKWIHSYIDRNEIKMCVILGNAVLDMYTKCGNLKDAETLFDKMVDKDIVSWTTMLVGYAKTGQFDAAMRVFDAMPKQDIAAWNALISGYEQNGRPKQALEMFYKLQASKIVTPDEITFVSTLSACAQLGAIDSGEWVHVYIKKHWINLNCHLATSLIDMYSKCGDLEKALEVFSSVKKKDVFVWSAMIAGLAMQGRGNEAIELFFKMNEAKVKPNEVTFTNLLSACSHAGLVEKGKLFFKNMEHFYGVEPTVKHYASMVDILGRAGYLEEALEFIEKMPIPCSASTWGALLGACKIHGNLKLAEHACTQLLELEPKNHGAYVLLSNIYAKEGKWDDVSRLRNRMREAGVKKEPGCSSIEVHGVVHEFLVGDNSHPLSNKIYSKLDEMVVKLKSVGYVPDKSNVLQLVEEEDMKERSLFLHSEKLAIAFALISTSSTQPIRIVKNLRICGDCHLVGKLTSKVYNREIFLRDRYRFHHFKDGQCSCVDYW